jgi:hypothetical protein
MMGTLSPLALVSVAAVLVLLWWLGGRRRDPRDRE